MIRENRLPFVVDAAGEPEDAYRTPGLSVSFQLKRPVSYSVVERVLRDADLRLPENEIESDCAGAHHWFRKALSMGKTRLLYSTLSTDIAKPGIKVTKIASI
jgi:hypothetical protein